MSKLVPLIYIVVGATLAGVFMVVALTAGFDTTQPVVYSALAGFVVGLPVTWIIAKKIADM